MTVNRLTLLENSPSPPYPPDMGIGARIKARRGELRVSQARLAEAVGVTQATVSDWEKGKFNPTRDVAKKVAQALEMTPAELELSSDPLPAPNAVIAPKVPPPPFRHEMPNDVPVLGTAAGGDGVELVMSGEVLQYAPRPRGIMGRKGVFALFTQGESMVPWRLPGQIVYVDPHRAPYIGDHVLIELRATDPAGGPEHGALIKRLVKLNSEFVCVAQYNPAREDIKIMRKRIARILRVIEVDELLGV